MKFDSTYKNTNTSYFSFTLFYFLPLPYSVPNDESMIFKGRSIVSFKAQVGNGMYNHRLRVNGMRKSVGPWYTEFLWSNKTVDGTGLKELEFM